MIALNAKVWRSALLRRFCATKPKGQPRTKLDRTQYFNLVFDRKINLEEEVHENYSKVRGFLGEQYRLDHKSQHVPAARVGTLFSAMVEKNFFNNPGSEIMLTYMLSLINENANEEMTSFFKGIAVDSEAWFLKNLPTKLEVLVMLLEFSAADISAEVVSSIDESLATVLSGQTADLSPFEAMEATVKVLQINRILKDSAKPTLTKTALALDGLKSVYASEQEKALAGDSLPSMVHSLELLHYTDADAANTKRLTDNLDAYVRKNGISSLTVEMWPKLFAGLAKLRTDSSFLLQALESDVIENLDKLSIEDISLVVRVYAGNRSGSVLFYADLERTLASHLDQLTNTALVEVLTSLTIARDFVSQNFFKKIASKIEKRITTLTASQVIHILRLYEFAMVEVFYLRQHFLKLTRSESDLNTLSLEDLILALDTVNFLGEDASHVAAAIDKKVETKSIENVSRFSASTTSSVLAALAEARVFAQLKPQTIEKLVQGIASQIPLYHSNQSANLVQALVRFDEEWDAGTMTETHLRVFSPVLDAVVAQLVQGQLPQEELYFAINFFAKLGPRWQAASRRLFFTHN